MGGTGATRKACHNSPRQADARPPEFPAPSWGKLTKRCDEKPLGLLLGFSNLSDGWSSENETTRVGKQTKENNGKRQVSKKCTLKLQVLRQLLSVEAYHGHSIRDLLPMLHLLTSTNDLCSKLLRLFRG